MAMSANTVEQFNPNTDEQAPVSLDAEQAILGAILFDNEILIRASQFLKSEHFFDPVHQLVYDAAKSLIDGGRLASPVALDTYLASSEGYREAGGRKYLEQLAANLPSTTGAIDYARIVFDLSTCRGLMSIGAEMVDRAKTSSLDDTPSKQLQEAEQALYSLAETGKYGGGFKSFRSSLTEAIELADAAFRRGGGLAGTSTGLRDLDRQLGGMHPSDLIILAGRPSMGKSSLGVNIGVNAAKAHKTERQPDGTEKTVAGAVVGLFSLEMSAEQIATRIISDFARVPSEKIRRGEIEQSEFDDIYHATRELESLPIFIDDTGGLSHCAGRRPGAPSQTPAWAGSSDHRLHSASDRFRQTQRQSRAGNHRNLAGAESARKRTEHSGHRTCPAFEESRRARRQATTTRRFARVRFNRTGR